MQPRESQTTQACSEKNRRKMNDDFSFWKLFYVHLLTRLKKAWNLPPFHSVHFVCLSLSELWRHSLASLFCNIYIINVIYASHSLTPTDGPFYISVCTWKDLVLDLSKLILLGWPWYLVKSSSWHGIHLRIYVHVNWTFTLFPIRLLSKIKQAFFMNKSPSSSTRSKKQTRYLLLIFLCDKSGVSHVAL